MSMSGGECEICGASLTNSNAQMAHRIANTKTNRALYGDIVVDSVLNVAFVCSLKCNDACNIGNNPLACYELAKKIYARKARGFE